LGPQQHSPPAAAADSVIIEDLERNVAKTVIGLLQMLWMTELD
jgi:hypothetical protein